MKSTGSATAHARGSPVATRWRSTLDRGVLEATRASGRPVGTLGRILAVNASLAGGLTALGWVVLDDQAAFYREMMPGTWLSAGLLLSTAVIAEAIHRVVAGAGSDFWSLSAVVLTMLAVIELTQPTVFLSKWLRTEHQIGTPGPFNDIDALLLVVLLVVCVALLARHALVLLRHRTTVVLFAIGLTVGFGSQTLDSFAAPTKWEFVVEECLKLWAISFVLAGYLAALRDTRDRTTRVAAIQHNDASSAPTTQPATTSDG